MIKFHESIKKKNQDNIQKKRDLLDIVKQQEMLASSNMNGASIDH